MDQGDVILALDAARPVASLDEEQELGKDGPVSYTHLNAERHPVSDQFSGQYGQQRIYPRNGGQ